MMGIRLRGYMGLLVLKVVNECPTHAYGLLKKLREITGHEELSVGVLYPILRVLMREGLITVRVDRVSGRERKLYYITEEGRKFLIERADDLNNALRIAEKFRILKDIGVGRVFKAVRNVFEVADSLSDDERERLRRLFREFEEEVNKIIGG